jgi:hypothetical protein
MIRRIAVAAVTGALCAALVVPASAFTRRQAICVKGARTRAKQSLLANKIDVQNKLNEDLSACLNDTDGCVAGPATATSPGGCITVQAACQAAAKANGADCLAKCKTDNSNVDCSTDPDPIGCTAKAQLTLFTCNQTCQATLIEPGIIDCNGAFNDCLQTCSNPDTTTTTTLP